MSYILVVLLVFSALFQPGVVWPFLEKFRPFFAIALLSVIATVINLPRYKGTRKMSSEFKLIIGLSVAEIISVVQYFWLEEILNTTLFWIKLIIIFFSIVYNIDTFQKVKTLLWVCVIAITLVSAISYYDYVTMDTVELQYRENESEDEFVKRAYIAFLRENNLARLSGYGMYSGANDFALMITICLPFIIKLFELEHHKLKRIFLFFLGIFFLYLVFLTVSRGGFIGSSIVISLSIYSARNLGSLSNSQVFKTTLIVLMVVGSVSIMVVKLAQRSDASSMLGGDRSAEDRLEAWIAGARMLAKNPFWGVGFDHFPSNVAEYGGPRRIQAHNTIVKVAAETGFIGLFCYLTLFYFSFKRLYYLMRFYDRKNEIEKVLIIQAVFYGLIGFFFNTQFSVKEDEWLLYILLGLTAAIYKINEYEYPGELQIK